MRRCIFCRVFLCRGLLCIRIFEHFCNFIADAHHVSTFVLSAPGVAVSVESAVEHLIALGSVCVKNEYGRLRFVNGFQVDWLVQNFFYVY